MKRKWICTLLAAAMVLGLCACTADKPAEPTPTPAEAVTPTPEPEEIYIVRMDSTLYRSSPESGTDNVLGAVNKGTEAALLDEDGDFLQVRLPDGQEVWISGWYLDAKDPIAQRQRQVTALREKMASETFQPLADGEDGTFTCMANLLNCRAEPSTDSTILYQVSFGTVMTAVGKDGEFYLCQLKDGSVVYCHEDYLTNEATYVELENAVDLRVYLPTLDFELLFASSNNITGEAMYPAIPLLEASTAEMLAKAQAIFREDGYSIKIYDAYRPKSAQFKLYDIVNDSRFIADPYRGQSWHQLGRAVDMSLIDMATGKELEMPTPMHTFSVDAARYNTAAWSEEAKKNSDYMTEGMTSVGFTTITTEWWHFENRAEGNYLDPDLDYDTLTYKPVSEYVAEHSGN